MKKCTICEQVREDNVALCCNAASFVPVEEEPVVDENVEPEVDPNELLKELVDCVDLDQLEVDYPEYIENIPVEDVREYAKKHYRENDSIVAKVKKYLEL